ncbi:MAG: 2-isopropylmalate synthase [bacterium]
MEDKIVIFDTTLRDGEQSPGASLNVKEKVEVAKQLARLNVDVIEAGFPISSPGDFEAVSIIGKTVKGPIIAGLARAKPEDIDRAWEALKDAHRPRIHTFISTSDIHLKHQFRMTREQALERAVEMVRRAKKYVDDVEFSPMDASRSDPEYLYRVLEAVIDAGAKTVNIPDTVGYAIPEEFGALIRRIKENVPNIDRAVISVHCHNDLGLAVANSLSAIRNGARQVECTVNGIGERAGNASLEEVVMALKTRKDLFGVDTSVNTKEIYNTSRLVSHLTGIGVQRNKAIVGANAFAHESGIHQDGILKERTTYEIMRAEDVGWTTSQLVLGKHSGRHAFREHLKEMGYELSEEEFQRAFEKFKILADKKKEVFDEDIRAIIGEEVLSSIPEEYELESFQITSGNFPLVPMASVKIKHKGESIMEVGRGDGPVDALYQALGNATKTPLKLVDFSINAITVGKDALGEAVIKVEHQGKVVQGKGTSTDILEASAKAYLNAVNKISYRNSIPAERKEGL